MHLLFMKLIFFHPNLNLVVYSGIKFENKQNEEIAKVFMDKSREEETKITKEKAQLILRLWEDRGIQKCYL